MNEENIMLTRNLGVPVKLNSENDFLKVKETLERIGVASYKDKKFFPSCNILFKKGQYYIVHFKSLFELDGRQSDISETDLFRRNTIAFLLEDWGLLSIIDYQNYIDDTLDVKELKILKHSEKNEWQICPKYRIGNKKFVKK